MKLFLKDTGTEMMIIDDNIGDISKLSCAIKSHLVKRKIKIEDILQQKNINYYSCNWCGKINPRFYLIVSINDGEIDIKDTDYMSYCTLGGRDPLRRAKHLCVDKSCPSKKLNGNSIEFVKRAYGFETDEETIQYLHDRNSSPFYKENHENLEKYKESQSGFSESYKPEVIKKIRYANSLEFRKLKYGDELGEQIHNNINKSKAITLQNYITNGYTLEEAQEKYYSWKRKVAFSKENYIRRFGNIEGPLKYLQDFAKKRNMNISQISRLDALSLIADEIYTDPNSRCSSYPIEKILLQSNFLTALQEHFNFAISEIENELYSREYGYKTLEQIKRGKYGLLSWTPDGTLLRSHFEYLFYNKIQQSPLAELPFEIDQYYPCKKFKFDFYFPTLGEYVEIAGLAGLEWYDKKLNIKIKKYNCLVSYDITDHDNIIAYLVSKMKEIKE